MRPWEDPEILEHIYRIVHYGCLEYRKVFEMAGLECATGRESAEGCATEAPREVVHEFLLYLERKSVTFEGVTFWRSYLVKVFKSFAEDLRWEVERKCLRYGDLEAEPEEGTDGRATCAPGVALAARRYAQELASSDRGRDRSQESLKLRALLQVPARDQLNTLLENYPLVRDSEPLMNRLRELYFEAFGTKFPEAEADALWESQRGGDCARVARNLELLRIALSDLRTRRAEAFAADDRESAGVLSLRLAALQHRETEYARRRDYLLRLKPSHVHQILPSRRRPTLNALTVAMHRSRERLHLC